MTSAICKEQETSSASDMAEYRRLVARFDHLWENAATASAQREMQALVVEIERYEARFGIPA